MNNPHINKELLDRFHDNKLTGNETISLLDHISKCTYCADVFASSFQNKRLLHTPANLRESILLKTQDMRVFPRRQLFFYSLRVCAAMCGALFILFSAANGGPGIKEQITIPQKAVSQSQQQSPSFMEELNNSLNQLAVRINERMNDFVTAKPNDTEVNNNDKTEK